MVNVFEGDVRRLGLRVVPFILLSHLLQAILSCTTVSVWDWTTTSLSRRRRAHHELRRRPHTRRSERQCRNGGPRTSLRRGWQQHQSLALYRSRQVSPSVGYPKRCGATLRSFPAWADISVSRESTSLMPILPQRRSRPGMTDSTRTRRSNRALTTM